MYKSILLIVLIFSVIISIGQDTIIVQTLTFDSITARRGIWEFPDSTHTFRKILMSYTLKCDAATTQDGYACGEWDYLTYSNIYDHTGELDSNYAEKPQYITGTTSPDLINTSSDQTYSIFQEEQYILNIDSVISETETIIGVGVSQMEFGEMTDGRVQFFWPDSVLIQSGLTAGIISGIKLDIESIGTSYFSLKIKMKHANSSNQDNFDSNNLTEVFNRDTLLSNTGWHNFNFYTPFTWDGVNGILIEFSYDNSNEGINSNILGSIASENTGIYATGSDDYLRINTDNYVSVPVGNLSGLISDEITISFWQYGDPNIQPQSDYIFEAYDINNKRVISTHLPWSNGNVYWDAGNTGGTYDRISKPASFDDYAGKWNHWAMTKNSNTGYMKIYLNGVLWLSGNGKTRTMSGIEKFIIGSSAKETGFYDGFINEFRIWNMELPDSLISQWMNKSVDNTHPLWNNLICYYNFDNLSGHEVPDLSGVTGNGYLMGSPDIIDVPGEDFFMNPELTTYRPNITFVQGDYLSNIETVIVSDTVYHSPLSIVEFAISTNEVLPIDTMWHFEGGWNYVFDYQGVIIDSIFFPIQQSIINSMLQYYEPPFEIINRYEIGRFITPYGIGLDLGPDGFTWIYDVTDYAPLLTGPVDLSSGNQQELIDIKFIMIEGTPAREVKEITRIWGQRSSYTFNDLDGDNKLSNIKIGLNSDAETFKIKTRLTGHGHNTSTGSYPHCCEWWNNTHYLIVNGDSVEQWHIWQTYDCAQNPVYPQGGTWPGSREGWCPGDKVKDNEFEITEYIYGDSVEIDYEITDIPSNNPGMGGGNYVIAMQLMQYGEPNFMYDAEIIDVISPNKFGYYSRENPICNNPKVLIRNSGSTVLTNLEFEYSVSGDTPLSYSWVGNLKFMEEEIVSLPVIDEEFWGTENINNFYVNVFSPNGNQDENIDNDNYKSSFETPNVYDNNLIIMYLSNNLPNENYYEITDINDNIVFSRYQATANTIYYDTLDLLPGCYTFNLYDSGNDGLYYWAYPDQGSGFLRLKKNGGGTYKFFEPEFGHNIMYAFSINNNININDISYDLNIELFPNPANNLLYFDVSGYTGDIYIQIFDITGKKILSDELFVHEDSMEKIDVSMLHPGTYVFNAIGKNISFTRSLIINP